MYIEVFLLNRPFDASTLLSNLVLRGLCFFVAKLQKVYLCSKIKPTMSDNLKQSTGIRILLFLVILLISGLAIFGGTQAAMDGQGSDAHILQAFSNVDNFAVFVVVA